LKNQESDIKSQGDTKSSDQSPAKSRKKRRVRRWIYWVSGIFIIVFIIIPLLANFYADRIFGETAREIIRSETNGKYDFEYDKISFNIFSRDLSIAKLQLLPDTNKVDSISGKFELPKKYFDLQVDELHIKLDGLWSVLLKRELTVTDIYLGKPSMRFVSPMAAADTTARSGGNFDHRDLHSYIKDYLSLLKIEQLTIDSGLFVLHSVAAGGVKVIKLDHISIGISNFHLDSVAHQQKDRLFFSDSIGVSLKGGHFDLKDKDHEIAFGGINVSSTEQSIELLDVLIRKDSTGLDASEALYEIAVPRLAFDGVDFVGALDGKLLAGQLLISRPAIKLNLPPKHQKGKLPENFETEIFNEVASVFYPVNVDQISIEHADFAIENLLPGAMDGFHVPDLSLDLFKIRIDSSLISSSDPFYFISDIKLSLLNQELVLTKLEQKIAFDTLNFDTRNSTFIIDRLNVASLNEAKLRIEVTVDLPQLKIVGKDFKKDFVDRTLNLELVELLRPVVNLDLDPLVAKGDKNPMGDNINALSGGILKSLSVDQFRLVDAGIIFGKGSGIFDQQLIADKLNIEVTDFMLPEDSLQIEDNIFYSSAIDIDVENLEFKLPDSVHQLNMNRFMVDTKKGTLSLDGVHIDTLKTIAGSTFNQGDRMKIDVGHFKAMAVDFAGLYKQGYIDIGEISIRNPKLFVSDAKDKDANSVGKIPDFLKNYSVGSLSIIGLDLVIEEAMPSKSSIKFTQGDILATDIKPSSYEHFEELLTDSLELSFESIFYQPPRGTQVIATDYLHISKKDSLLHIKNFELYPGDFSVDHFDKGWALHIPDIEVSGFAIHRAIYNKELLVQKVFADHTLFRVVTGKSTAAASTPTLDLTAIKEQLLKTFNIWDVRTIEFDNSSVEAFSGTTYNTEIIDIEDFTIKVDDMYIDSTVRMTRDNVLFAGDVQFHLNKPITFKGKKDQLVELKDFSLTTKGGSLIAQKFTMTENQSSLNPDVIDESKAVFGFDEVDVLGIDFFDLLENRKLGIDSIMVEAPVFLLKREYTANQKKVKPQSKINFYDLISDHLFEARIDDFNVNDASFKIVNSRDGEKSTFLVNRVDVAVRNIFIDSVNDVFNNKFLYSDDIDLVVEDYTYNTRNGLYSLGASNISFSSEDALLLIDSGFVTPLLEPAAFAKKVGIQTDRLDFAFDQARLENFRLYDLFFNNYFRADYFYLTGLEGEDYRDKSYDRPKNHFPHLPVAGLKNLAMGVRLDSARIENSRFTYRELMQPDTMPGRIWFDDISVKARNITNDEKLIASRPTMGFVVNTKLMGEGAIDMTVLFDLKSGDTLFSVKAVLNPMDLTKMNPLLEHIAFVKVKKGQNEMLTFNFDATNEVATGKMNFEYNNLAIRLISKESLQPKGFGGGVASFVANTFVVRSKNPAWGIFNRKGTIYFQRDKTRSFFNYLAKSALSGVSSTIRGGNEERKEDRIKKKAERKKGNR